MTKHRFTQGLPLTPLFLSMLLWGASVCSGQESIVEQMGEALMQGSPDVKVWTAEDMERLRTERKELIDRPTPLREEEDQTEEVRDRMLRGAGEN
jgi:hypothetical protein